MHCLTITPLVAVVALSHIHMSTLDVLSELSSSCQMAAGTPSGLCCHWDSIAAISAGVPSWILKHCGCCDWDISCTHRMSACMSCMGHAGVIAFMALTISIKNGSVVGHRLNHCAFLKLVQLKGQGNFPVVGLPLSMVLQSLGDSPGALALVSIGIQQLAPLGEADWCSEMAPRLCFFHHDSVYHSLPHLTKGGVGKWITWQSCQVIFLELFNTGEGQDLNWRAQSSMLLSFWDSGRLSDSLYPPSSVSHSGSQSSTSMVIQLLRLTSSGGEEGLISCWEGGRQEGPASGWGRGRWDGPASGWGRDQTGWTTHIGGMAGPAVATVIGGSIEAFAVACKWPLRSLTQLHSLVNAASAFLADFFTSWSPSFISLICACRLLICPCTCSSASISMLLMNPGQALWTMFSMSEHSKLIWLRLWAPSRWLMYSWQKAQPFVWWMVTWSVHPLIFQAAPCHAAIKVLVLKDTIADASTKKPGSWMVLQVLEFPVITCSSHKPYTNDSFSAMSCNSCLARHCISLQCLIIYFKSNYWLGSKSSLQFTQFIIIHCCYCNQLHETMNGTFNLRIN